MIDGFQAGDYILCGLTVVMAVLGLFRGFSGTLGFVLAVIASGAVAVFGWRYSVLLTSVEWQRAGVVLVASLLAFGIVRLVVRKLVNGLLAQPSDAIFGFLTGTLFGVAILAAWAYTGFHLELSSLAREVSPYVR